MTSRKIAISAHFDTAHEYDQVARIQKECASRLISKLASHTLSRTPHSILEIGCGTGFLTQKLRTLFPHSLLCATDISPAMLTRTQQKIGKDPCVTYHEMDGEQPQEAKPAPSSAPFDLITSNLCWQWFIDRPNALHRLVEQLTPGGTLMISTLLEQSLEEWRISCANTQTPCGVPLYPSSSQLNTEWPPNGKGSWSSFTLSDPVPSARIFLKELRQIGASLPHKSHSPVHPHTLRRAMKWFDTHYNTVSYHVGFGLFTKDSL